MIKVFFLASGGASGIVYLANDEAYGKDYKFIGGFTNNTDAKALKLFETVDSLDKESKVICLDYRNWRQKRGFKKYPHLAKAAYHLDVMKNIPRDVDLIILSGYMLILPKSFIRRYRGRIINVHPARLDVLDAENKPLYVGDNAVELALIACETHTASTVHFASEIVDCGQVICISEMLEYDPTDSYAEHQNKMKTACDGPALVQAMKLITSSVVPIGIPQAGDLPETRMILVHNQPHDFRPIADFIDLLQLSTDVVSLSYYEEVLNAIPKKGRCVVVLDSRFHCLLENATATDAARLLAAASKDKNPECITILYTGDCFDLDPNQFDYFFSTTDRTSWEMLFDKLCYFASN